MEPEDFSSKVLEFLNKNYKAEFARSRMVVQGGFGRFEFQFHDRVKNLFANILEYKGVTDRSHSYRRIEKMLLYIESRRKSKDTTRLVIVFNGLLTKEDKQFFDGSILKKFGTLGMVSIFDRSDVLPDDYRSSNKKPPSVSEVKELLDKQDKEGSFDALTDAQKAEHTYVLREASNITFFETFRGNYWWINSADEFWSLSETKPGDIQTYPKSGEKILRRNAEKIALGDIAIVYQKAPHQRLTSIYQVVPSEDRELLAFRMIHELSKMLSWEDLQSIELFKNSSIGKTKANGSFHRLDKSLFLDLVKRSSSFYRLAEDIIEIGIGFNDKSNKTVKPETSIDLQGKFVFGKEIGEEINNYNILFLPKTALGPIGLNGVAAHILEILGLPRDTFSFTQEDFKRGFKWFQLSENNRQSYICFIVTRNENKELVSFELNISKAVEEFIIKYGEETRLLPPNIFIPFLGAGAGGMPVQQSFERVIKGIQLFKETFAAPRIRINYPPDSTEDQVAGYSEHLIEVFGLDPYVDKGEDPLHITSLQKDKIPFHLDVVEEIDRLNREPVAKSLARLINEDVFDKTPNSSFMIHLQGSWGAGKSTFLNLLEKHLKTENRKWVVVKYNAWQNQHISPPWWSFIDQIYRQSKKEMSFWSARLFAIQEKTRRIVKYGRWQKGMLLALSLICVVLFVIYGKSLLQLAGEFPSVGEHDSKTSGISLELFAKLITSVAAAIGAVYSISKFIATPLFMKNSSEAKSFVQHVADPMQTIKTHFENLVSNVNNSGFEVAVFIDDLDRCDRKYTIELLEGIQTLFKDKRVLYVVAGDKDWIATCFEKNYAEFSDVVGNNKKLGELFLEKAFQLSIRLPQMSGTSKKKYWDFILGNKTLEKEKVSDEVREEIKRKVKIMDIAGDKSGMNQLDDLETEFNATEAEISDVMLEVLDENQADIKHLLTEHHTLIEANPRAIIRLANEYTMFRNILWAERIQFNSDILFRWIILESSFPIITSQISNNIAILESEEFKALIAKLEEKEKFDKLFFDPEGKHGGEMKTEQLADILGISLEKK